ncbi:hypothetical protein BS50DRAFT_641131 [Corynespora cassiicola Philippines]|uniref:Uncharacterized protein n=1 Tax=Corynespora cassiicola Philippines TaxID=1448308 RepID=A0A2T2N1Y2_CORCC|nr:hypothetical protein BS50DRAFT_641131 [Corynespora cassiicola Philippines]
MHAPTCADSEREGAAPPPPSHSISPGFSGGTSVSPIAQGEWLLETSSVNQCLNQYHASRLQYLLLEDDVFSSGRGLEPELSRYFHLPRYMLSDVYQRSNGFFNFEKSLDENGHLQSYHSWFRFQIKDISPTGSSDYTWHEMTFFSSWVNDQSIILCVGADLIFQSTLQRVLSQIEIDLSLSGPFSLHAPIVETIIAMQDVSVWSVRDVVRGIEKGRFRQTRDSREFLSLHETARHAIHSFETLNVTVETLDTLQHQVMDLSLSKQSDKKQAYASCQIRSQFGFQVQMLRNLLHRSQSNKERLQNEISLAYNMITQRDSQVMTGLGEATKLDSGAMRTIAVVTMAFLPPTFLSAVFSMSFFNYSPAQDGQASTWSLSDKFWVYWAFAVPLTCLTMAIWFWRQKGMRRGTKLMQLVMSQQKRGNGDYTVGWICAITTEYVAAQAFLDEKHGRPEHVHSHDNNDYTLGRIGQHNVVVAVLPEGEYGTSSAAVVARDMLHSFPNVRIGLMVGIGGGAPSSKHDIRLGDIVVSAPRDGKGGVFQYDFGKTIQEQSFRPTGFLNQPPTALRTAMGGLKAEYESDGHQLDDAVNGVLGKKPRLKRKYQRPGPDTDKLYLSGMLHPTNDEANCAEVCGGDPSKLVPRNARTEEDDNPAVHYGIVASANQLMKDALLRDKFAKENGVLCFEMEAAGLMNHFPCLVIRGICDYSDTHKNKDWQGYAAMTAAAYAKDLLNRIPVNKVEAERRISDVLSSVEQNVYKVRRGVEDLAVEQRRGELHRWLSPPEPSTNYNKALQQRQEGTGSWFLHSDAFNMWKSQRNSFLWLYGIPGCGKTILSSTIIEHLRSLSTQPLLYFYFDFTDSEKQTLREQKNVHFLVTSRPEQDIQSEMDHLISEKNRIAIQSDLVNADILAYIHAKVRKGEGLKRWRSRQDVQREIEEKLAQKADGMFRWVACQIDVLEGCLDYPTLSTALESLPKTLDETYARILKAIPDVCKQNALRILQFLTFSERPLRLEEAVDAIAVNVDGSPHFSSKNRMPEPQEITHYCSSLVVIVSVKDENETTHMELQLAHFSVKEYLTSDRLNSDTAQALRENAARASVAMACLAYLLHFDQVLPLERIRKDFPFAKYCARFWMSHALAAEQGSGEMMGLIDRFFCYQNSSYKVCYSLYRPDEYYRDSYDSEPASGLYYAAFGGLRESCRLLLNKGADVNAEGGIYGNALCAASYTGHKGIVELLIKEGADVNVHGGHYGNALQAASSEGHKSIVELLIKKGADVKAQGGEYGNVLCAASWRGHKSIVELLIKEGADFKAQGGHYGNALQAASWEGHNDIVELLIKEGADVNVHGGHYGNALQAASWGGHKSIVELLIKAGADVKAEGGEYGNALQSASERGHKDIVELLVKAGADVNAQGGKYGNALYAALARGHKDIYGNALYAALARGHKDIVELLVKAGADVNAQERLVKEGANVKAQGGYYGNALHAASSGGYEDIVELLRKSGAT